MATGSSYEPPVSDYAFLFGEAFGLDIVARGSAGELTATDATEIVAGAGDFASSVLAPLEVVGDREGAQLVDGEVRLPEGFAAAYRAFVDAGWITAEAPVSAGGDGLRIARAAQDEGFVRRSSRSSSAASGRAP